MKTKPAFALLSCLLFLVVGCDKAQRATTQTNENNFNDLFKTQLMQFLSSASQVNAATEAGVSKQDLSNIYIVAKGQFDLLEKFWPEDFCPEAKTDMQEAFKGWSYAKADFKPGSGIAFINGRTPTPDIAREWPEAQPMYLNLSQYEANPFGIQFIRVTNQEYGEIAINMEANMPRLLSIASQYFERGRQSIVTEIKKRSNAP